MNERTLMFALLMLTASGGAGACTHADAADCVAAALLADARSEAQLRYRESDERGEQGPLTVRVTTFDSSPSTPGVWYERPHGNSEDEALPYRQDTPRAPFDRH